MIGNFIEALMNYEFLQRALITAIMVGVVSGVIGSFVILRGMSLMGDAISHAVLPGVAISYMLGMNYMIGATIFGLMSAFLISFLTQKTELKSDTAIGIVFSTFFALGIILISFTRSSTDLNHILFGNVLAVKPSDLYLTLGVGVLVLLFVVIFYKELLISSFDPTMAKAYGLKTNIIHYGLMFFLTLIAVSSLQTVGAILVIAMLVTPAATSYLLTDRLAMMIFLSAGIGAISAILGLFFSYSFNLATGPTIVLTSAIFFIIAFLFAPKKGILFKKKESDENENLEKN